jgi:guanylate kinase
LPLDLKKLNKFINSKKMFISHKPFLIIISSPSGAGKSTLCKMLIQNDPLIKLSVSATTRPKRPMEIDKKDYFFIDKNHFEKLASSGEFIEFAKVFEYEYGTPKKLVEDGLKNGNEVLFDIDWQGARQIRQKFKKDEILSIFILPPSMTELERRLNNRAEDDERTLKNRMKKAKDEIGHFDEYDFILINDDLNNAYQKIRAIVDSKRVERFSRDQILNFIQNLL